MFVTFIYPQLPRTDFHFRPDDKTADDFNIAPGAVLHLVLALRGGQQA